MIEGEVVGEKINVTSGHYHVSDRSPEETTVNLTNVKSRF